MHGSDPLPRLRSTVGYRSIDVLQLSGRHSLGWALNRIAVPDLMPRSLAGQFLLANLVVLLLGMLVVGGWVSQAIERGVLNRSGALTALYVSSVLGDDLQVLATQSDFDPAQVARFDHLLLETPLGQRVVAFKIWSPGGQVLYSTDRRVMGQQFEPDEGLDAALAGDVTAELSDLRAPENRFERDRWSRLLEVYAPLREQGPPGRILGAVEFYESTDELDSEVASARFNTWAVVGAVTMAVYVLLAGIVKRGSNTIDRQRDALERQVLELSSLLEQNAALHRRVRRAAEHTTALNEQALKRISADLHDGPGQTLGLALLRLERLEGRGPTEDVEVSVVRGAVQDALGDVRAISTGLRLPMLESLSVEEVAERAVHAHERRSGCAVQFETRDPPPQAPLSVKITLFRTLEEALSNATRHGGGVGLRATLEAIAGSIRLAVRDEGPGFCPNVERDSGHLGLLNMRERAELLGGTFEVVSAPGQGCTVKLCLPLAPDAT
jgi:signal transduction histidine kinase